MSTTTGLLMHEGRRGAATTRFGRPIFYDRQIVIRICRRLVDREDLRAICAEPGMELAGTARDGEDAVAKARELRPDVVTMDINMPKLDGITALQMILEEKICPVVMVSSLTQRGAMTTFECLELGAFDFVGKPDGTVSANRSRSCAPPLVRVCFSGYTRTVRGEWPRGNG